MMIQDRDCWIMQMEALSSFETSTGHDSDEMQLLQGLEKRNKGGLSVQQLNNGHL
jgi:hypothetical protein